ncbi:hypothetical protein V6N13_133495 [Hibiscus sabdariffa]
MGKEDECDDVCPSCFLNPRNSTLTFSTLLMFDICSDSDDDKKPIATIAEGPPIAQDPSAPQDDVSTPKRDQKDNLLVQVEDSLNPEDSDLDDFDDTIVGGVVW